MHSYEIKYMIKNGFSKKMNNILKQVKFPFL